MSVTHHTFSVDRSYDASPERVYAAWANLDEKRRWWAGGDDGLELDFRVGGRELSEGTAGDMRYRYEAVYQDIVENERIIYAYDMHIGDQRISASLATIELKPEGKGTRLTFTEQGAFLDGYDDSGSRERGSRELVEKLSAYLEG